MHKLLKVTGILLGIVLVLILLAIVSLVTFVSPNRLKPVLTAQVLKYTGRTLVIDGDMAWTFFPTLGVKVGHSTLGNPAGFPEKTFAEISHITVSVKLVPLLSRQIESSGIVLDGMKLSLIKNKAGQVNWNFKIKAPDENPASTTQQSSSNRAMALGLAVSGLDVTNATVDYIDQQTKKIYQIKNFELHAKNINLLKSFPMNAAFDFTANNPPASGHATVQGDIKLDMASQIYTVNNLRASANVLQNMKKTDLTVSGNLVADLNQQTLQWNAFRAKVANVDVKGNLAMKTDNSGVNMEGTFGIDTLQAAKLTLTNVAVKAHFQKGILDLAPMSANLYQGTLTGQTMVNFNAREPQITLHAKLNNVQAQPLLDDLGGKDQKIKIAGLGNLELQVTTVGTDSQTVLKNLNGIGQFSFKNGALVGVDVGYLVDSAYALVKHQPMTTANTGRTDFGVMTGTAVIRSGVLNNNDLNADAPRFAIRGSGSVDLVNQKIDYALQALIKQRADQKDNVMNLYGISLPVLITGNLQNPTVRLDTITLGKAIAARELSKATDQAKEKLKEQIKNKAGGLLNGKAGDVLNNLLGN